MLIDYKVISLITAVISFCLGLFVYFKNTKSTINRTWLALSCCVSIWSFGIFALHNSPDAAHALFWLRFMYVGSVGVPPFFLHLIFSILEKNRTTRDHGIIIIFYSISVFFLASNFTSSLFVKGVKQTLDFEFFTDPGILFPFFGIFFLSTALYALYELIKAYSISSGVKRNQIKYICIATIVGFSGAMATMLPMLNIKTPPFGHYFILFYTLIVSYAIVKHQLMDIEIIIKKGAVYAYLSFLIFVPCMFVIIFAQRYFFGQANTYFSFLAFCTLLLGSLVFLKVKPEIEDYIERTLFKRKYEYKNTLHELSEIIISFLDEKELFKKAGGILTKDLGTEKVSFFLLDREKKAYTLRASQNLKKSKIKELPHQDPFFRWLEKTGQAVVKEVLERSMDDPTIKRVVERLGSLESEVCIPLMTRDALIGIINLGHKRSGEMYSHEDLDLLTHFATQASVALENARLYQEMQRTQLLMRRTDRLSSLGSLTANLAHEIRNPLVTIKTFLDLMPERYKDKEFRGDYLKLASSELDRISTLVTELLSFAKPPKPNFRKRDVKQVLEEVLYLITVEATKRDIAFETNFQQIPQTTLDEDQMKQVFLNIFLNAMEAISAHGRISVTSRSIQKNGMKYVQVEIADTGKGIPKRFLEQIFDPFFTTKEKGSGLGLSISYQIMQDHHGTIEVESKPKKGTTFLVTIPSEN